MLTTNSLVSIRHHIFDPLYQFRPIFHPRSVSGMKIISYFQMSLLKRQLKNIFYLHWIIESVIQNKRIFAIHFFSSTVALELCQDLKNFYLCWFFLDEGNYHHRYYVTVCVLMSKLRHLWATGPEWVGPQQWID